MEAAQGGSGSWLHPADLESAVEVLDVATCWELMGGVEVGRLAIAAAGELDIFPVNFVVDEGTVVFRTAEGTKLVELVVAGRVAFEADGRDADGMAWSVVVKGEAYLLDRFDDIYHAENLLIVPWSGTPKERFVRITPGKVTGRRFKIRGTRESLPRR
jgi:uncharacterized protein